MSDIKFSTVSSATTTIVAAAAVSDDDHGLLWKLWHGITSGVEKILDFVYDAGMVIVTTAKRIWKFVIETSQQALSALSGLLKMIGVAIEDALTWLAEKLDWESITDTMIIFNEFFNTGIDMARDMLQEGGAYIDPVFEILEKEIGTWHFPIVPPQQVASSKPNAENTKEQKSFSSSPVFNWASSQVQQGNSKDNMANAAGEADATNFTDILSAMYDSIFKPLWENLKDACQACGRISNCFSTPLQL